MCNSEARLELYARLAWMPEYSAVYELEAEINGAAAAVEHYLSDHRRQQMSAGNENVRMQSMLRISQDHERLMRERSRHYVPFSQAIKAANWVIDQVPTLTWEKERKDRKIAGRTFGTKLLWKMLDVRPEPMGETNPDCSFCVFDQVNAMAGGGHGHGSKKFGGIGRIDEKGKRIEVQRETYVNIFDVHVSASDCRLSDAAREVIARRGPYTQDFSRILPVMAPERANTFMNEMLVNACTSLRGLTDVRLPTADPFLTPCTPRDTCNDCSQDSGKLSVKTAIREILGRKPHLGSPLRVTDLAPLMKTNTASLTDGVKICGHYRRFKDRRKEPRGIVCGKLGDGQSALLLSYLKRHWPDIYMNVLILCGGFHASGHFQLSAITILAWKPFYGSIASELERTPIQGERKGTLWPEMKNLDKNAHYHTQQFAYATVIATMIYIVNFVKSPPPELFLQNPILYMGMVKNASGIVMLQALLCVGLPIVEWHQAAREQRGQTVDRLYALAYHQYRCTHKTNSQVIAILHLLAMYATHPELRPWLWTTHSGILVRYAKCGCPYPDIIPMCIA